jgi:hypothetical protein
MRFHVIEGIKTIPVIVCHDDSIRWRNLFQTMPPLIPVGEE